MSVLVVDDESHIRNVVALKFRNAGFEVLTAGDGEEALERISDRTVDVIVIDYQMPYLNGVETCRRLASKARTSGIPAIMLTARGMSLTQDDLRDTIIRKVMAKPFGPRELLEAAMTLIRAAAVDGEAEAA